MLDMGLFEREEIAINYDDFNINEELKLFEGCKSHPTKILIRLYIKPNKVGSLYVPNSKSVYEEMVGYVAKMGHCAFTGERYKEWGEWYKIGDWVAFPRHAGIRYTYKNLPVFSIMDDSPLLVVSDPRDVK